jgi:hypothetical protein
MVKVDLDLPDESLYHMLMNNEIVNKAKLIEEKDVVGS